MNKYKIAAAVSVCVLVIAISAAGNTVSQRKMPGDPGKDVLRVVFFSVGNADCSLYFNGETSIMIDAPAGECEKVIGYMRRVGIKRLDCFVITHYDYDHCGDAVKILRAFDVDTVLMPEPSEDDVLKYNAIIDELKNGQRKSADAGTVYTFGETELKVLAPLYYISESDNDNSIVTFVKYRENRVLSCGDVGSDVETDLLFEYGYDLRCDILKIGHHGSRYSSSDDFISTVSPAYAVISCGENTYGHPSQEALANIEKAGAEAIITQADGSAVFDLSENGVVRLR